MIGNPLPYYWRCGGKRGDLPRASRIRPVGADRTAESEITPTGPEEKTTSTICRRLRSRHAKFRGDKVGQTQRRKQEAEGAVALRGRKNEPSSAQRNKAQIVDIRGRRDLETVTDSQRTGRCKETQGAVEQGCPKRLRVELGEDLYTSWFRRMEPEGRYEETLIVSVPTRFLRNWIQTHYQERLLGLCDAELGNISKVDIRVRPRGKPISACCSERRL